MDEAAIRDMAKSRREAIRELDFFDSNVWLGRPAEFPLAKELPAGELKATLDEYGISGALVSHWWAHRIAPQEGNAALHRFAQSMPKNVYVIDTGLPDYPDRETVPADGGAVPPGVRGIRIFPETHHFPLAAWCVGGLLRRLSEHRLPLFLWHVETDWTSLRTIAREFPDLKIVIETQTRKILYHTRSLFPLMVDCPNVMVELSNFAGPGFVEYVVDHFGPDRLIFGSFLPVNDPYVAMGMILDADISESDKAAIAGGNLRRMIGEVVP